MLLLLLLLLLPVAAVSLAVRRLGQQQRSGPGRWTGWRMAEAKLSEVGHPMGVVVDAQDSDVLRQLGLDEAEKSGGVEMPAQGMDCDL